MLILVARAPLIGEGDGASQPQKKEVIRWHLFANVVDVTVQKLEVCAKLRAEHIKKPLLVGVGATGLSLGNAARQLAKHIAELLLVSIQLAGEIRRHMLPSGRDRFLLDIKSNIRLYERVDSAPKRRRLRWRRLGKGEPKKEALRNENLVKRQRGAMGHLRRVCALGGVWPMRKFVAENPKRRGGKQEQSWEGEANALSRKPL